MAKRANGEGTAITQRPNGTWWARYTAPGGKRVPVYGKTQGEVKKKLDEIKAQMTRGEYVKNDALTMSGLFDDWFKHGETVKGWRDNTKQAHYQSIEKHLRPAFGNIRVQDLQPRQIQAHVNSLIERGYKSGGIHKIYEAMSGALNWSVRRDILNRSPMEKVDLPKHKQEEIKFLTREEQEKLLPHLPDTTGGRAARFALRTGLREGEICGLRWGDFDGTQITIRRTVRYMKRIVNGKREGRQSLVINPPKTDASADVLPLGKKALDIIAGQRKEQAAQCMRAGKLWDAPRTGSPDCYIFASGTGQALDPHNLNRTLRNALEAAGLEHRGMHALRHTFLTNAANEGIPLNTLKQLARHEKTSTTANLYLHADRDSVRQAVDVLDALA